MMYYEVPLVILRDIPETYSEPCQTSKTAFSGNSQQVKAVYYFRMKLYLRCLTGF